MSLGLNLSSISNKLIDKSVMSLACDWIDYSNQVRSGTTDMLCIIPNAFLRTTDTLCIICDSNDFIKGNASWFTLRNRPDDILYIWNGEYFESSCIKDILLSRTGGCQGITECFGGVRLSYEDNYNSTQKRS